MDAGELGTFLGGKMLFIDVDDHPESTTSMISSRSGAVDDCFKELTSGMGSEDDVGTPAHQLSTGGGSLSHASFGALGGDATGSDDEGNRGSNKRKRSNDLSALGFEVESSSSLVESAMRTASPVVEPMAHFFPPPPVHLTEGTDGAPRFFTSGMGTPLLPPPPNSNGVALGLPINPEIHHLRKQPTILRSTSNSSNAWGGATAPLSQLSLQYCKSAFGAPCVSPISGDLTAALNDVLRGKTTTPPLGLKLNIAAVVSELQASKLSK
jgi:hypothetical protein